MKDSRLVDRSIFTFKKICYMQSSKDQMVVIKDIGHSFPEVSVNGTHVFISK